jgi:carboxymethylenebutenolidase
VEHLRTLTGKPVGTVGFCMGGALSLFAACANGDRIGACVIYYGGHPKVSFDFERLTAPVLGHWAEHDDFANPNRDRIAKELARRGKPFEFHTYPGTKHAFFNDERPPVYDRAAAETSWARTLAFFRRHL